MQIIEAFTNSFPHIRGGGIVQKTTADMYVISEVRV